MAFLFLGSMLSYTKNNFHTTVLLREKFKSLFVLGRETLNSSQILKDTHDLSNAKNYCGTRCFSSCNIQEFSVLCYLFSESTLCFNFSARMTSNKLQIHVSTTKFHEILYLVTCSQMDCQSLER